MNFEQAFLWLAFLAAIGFIGYIFYSVIRDQRNKKEKPDHKTKKQEVRKTTPAPASRKAFVKTDQARSNILNQISDLRNSNVEVNITDYPINKKPLASRGKRWSQE